MQENGITVLSKVFDSRDIVFNIDGVPIKDFGQKGVVKIEPLSPPTELIIGVNDESIFLNNSNLNTKISFSLFQTSELNTFLNGLALVPIPVMPILIKSINPIGYIGFGIKARIGNRPTIDFQKTVQEVNWEIYLTDWYSAFTKIKRK